MHGGCPVGADQRAGAACGGDEGPVVGGIGAEIGDTLHLEREKAPVGVEREGGAGAQVAALVVGRHGLAPLGHPLDRAPQRAGREQHQRIFGIDPELDPEGAAHVGRHHAHAPGRHLEHVPGQDVPHQVDALRARRERVDAAARVVFAERGARLHGRADEPLVAGLHGDNVGRAAERVRHRRAVAQLPAHAEIARRVVVQRGRAGLERGLRIGHRRQRPVGDGDGLRRGAGFGGAFRHHEGDRVAHHAHAPGRKHRAGRQGGGAAVDPLERHHAGDPADPGRGQVGGGEDRAHPRHGRRSAGVDRADPGMGVGRPHHLAPGLARQRKVVEIAPAPGEEALVLRPPCRPAHALRHPSLPRPPQPGSACNMVARRMRLTASWRTCTMNKQRTIWPSIRRRTRDRT